MPIALLLALVEFSVIFAGLTAFFLTGRLLPGTGTDLARTLAEAAGLSLCALTGLYLTDLYNSRIVRSFQEVLRRVPRASITVGLLIVGFRSLVPDSRLAGNVLESSALITIAIIFGPLLPIRVITARIIRSRRFAKRLLIVGTSPLAQRLIEEIERRADPRYVVAAVAGEVARGVRGGVPFIVGSLGGLDGLIEEAQPDRIVVAVADREGWFPTQLLLTARVYQGLPIDDGVRVYERLTGKLAIEAMAPSHVIFGDRFCLSRLSLGVRRGVSLLIASLALAAAAPLFGLIALAVKLDSQGPVFFAQRRIGFRGRPFTLLKFRTMHPADRPTSEWARDNGRRITRVGRWLRRFWLDELPQLVNVIRGDMDLVGPRPHPVSNFELFVLVSRNAPECGEPIPYYSLRCMVRPGLTGWAQVRYGYANDLDEEMEKLRYDLYYIKHRSLWLDLRILLDTMKIVLSSRDIDAGGVRAPDSPVFGALAPAISPGSTAMAGNSAGLAMGNTTSWEVIGLEHEPRES